MGAVLEKSWEGWVEGCNTSIQAGNLPDAAFPRGRNVELQQLGQGEAVVACRPGVVEVNTTPLTGTNGILRCSAIFPLSRWNASYKIYLTNTLLIPTQAGSSEAQLFAMSPATGVATSIATLSTHGNGYSEWGFTHIPGYGIIGDQNNLMITTGTSTAAAGVTRPTLGTTFAVTTTAPAGTFTGEYELRVTYGISGIGLESSASDSSTTVVCTSDSLSWVGIPVSTHPLVDRRYLYARNTANQVNFYQVATIADNTTTTAVTTTAPDENSATVAPTTTENDPVPTGCYLFAWHRSRLVASDGRYVYWSKINRALCFDSLSSGTLVGLDNQRVTALIVFNDMLLICKERSIYAIIGDGPDTWVIRLVVPDVGSLRNQWAEVEGHLYLMSHQGPVRWSGEGVPLQIGLPLIKETLTGSEYGDLMAQVTIAQYPYAIGVDHEGQRILWSLPGTVAGLTASEGGRVTLPYSYRLGRWESDGWDPVMVSAWAEVSCLDRTTGSATGRVAVCGSESGGVFVLNQHIRGWDGLLYGVGSIVYNGSFTTTAGQTSLTTVTSTGSFTTSTEIIGRMMSIADANGELVARRRVAATATNSVTLYPAVTVSASTPYTWHLCQTALTWDTNQIDLGEPFKKKRFEYVYFLLNATIDPLTVLIESTLDSDSAQAHQTQVTTDPDADSSAIAITPRKLRIGRTGRIWQGRVTALQDPGEFALITVGLKAELLSDKLEAPGV